MNAPIHSVSDISITTGSQPSLSMSAKSVLTPAAAMASPRQTREAWLA
jgi:hypothetical protein